MIIWKFISTLQLIIGNAMYIFSIFVSNLGGNPLSRVFYTWAVQFPALMLPWAETNLKYSLNLCHSSLRGLGGPLLLSLHTRYASYNGTSQGSRHMVTFHNSVVLQRLIPQMPCLSPPLSSFFKVQVDSATPLLCCLSLPVAHTTKRESSHGVTVLCSFVCLPHYTQIPLK